MPGKLTHDVLPGGLSDSDRDAITTLFESGRRAKKIARRLRKHPSTVQWFICRTGLMVPQYRDRAPYRRGGRLVVPFSREEDAFIEALRVQTYSLAEIARIASARFETARSLHTIHCRLVMLAARETQAEAA